MSGPSDNEAWRIPVSVKGVILRDDAVLLVGNSRGEWELPGGKLEPGETPEACVAREIAEELALDVTVGRLLDAWVYRIAVGVEVLVLAYGCTPHAWPAAVRSPEGRAVGLFPHDRLPGDRLPDGYRRAVAAWTAG